MSDERDILEEEVLGYWVEGELVCTECCNPLTIGDRGTQDYLTRLSVDPDIFYLCTICRQRIV